MSVRDFIVFCETVCGRPLTAQQWALAQKLHERFMQSRRADLLIVDDVASSTEAAKLPIENKVRFDG